MCSSKKKAFTLIELSIVLVIIGLIVSGILFGKDLIHAAQIRATVSQLNNIDTAIGTFKLKYNAIPGDMKNATDFFSGTTYNGNGDGMITNSNGATELENVNLWHQLQMAGLIAGNYRSFPNDGTYDADFDDGNAYSPKTILGNYMAMGWTTVAVPAKTLEKHFYTFQSQPIYQFYLADMRRSFASGCNSTPDDPYVICESTAADAYAIDAKIDDGLPLTGKALDGATGFDFCNVPGDATHYDVNDAQHKTCYLMITSSVLD
jgi:prepilin-type N-terminal cleavage/methylation domain-containing protein